MYNYMDNILVLRRLSLMNARHMKSRKQTVSLVVTNYERKNI